MRENRETYDTSHSNQNSGESSKEIGQWINELEEWERQVSEYIFHTNIQIGILNEEPNSQNEVHQEAP